MFFFLWSDFNPCPGELPDFSDLLLPGWMVLADQAEEGHGADAMHSGGAGQGSVSAELEPFHPLPAELGSQQQARRPNNRVGVGE